MIFKEGVKFSDAEITFMSIIANGYKFVQVLSRFSEYKSEIEEIVNSIYDKLNPDLQLKDFIALLHLYGQSVDYNHSPGYLIRNRTHMDMEVLKTFMERQKSDIKQLESTVNYQVNSEEFYLKEFRKLLILQITNSNSTNLSINIEPGTASSKQIGDFLGELSVLYRMTGGSGINFTIDSISILQHNLVNV